MKTQNNDAWTLQGFGSLLESLDAVFWERDVSSGLFTFVSNNALLGYSPGDWLRDYESWTKIVRPDATSAVENVRTAGIARGGQFDHEFPACTAAGRAIWLREVVECNGDFLRGVWMDISSRVLALQALAADHQGASALSESSTTAEAGPKLLKGVGEALDMAAGALWLVDPDHSDTMIQKSFWAAGKYDSSIFAKDSSARAFKRGEGLVGVTWEKAQPQWVTDVESDPRIARRDSATASGFLSAVSVPVKARNRIRGVLEFFSTNMATEDHGVVTEALSRIGLTLGQFIRRRRAEENQSLTTTLLRTQSEAGLEGQLIVSPTGEIVFYNKRFAEIWNMPEEVLVARSDKAALANAMQQVVDPEAFIERIEYLYSHPDEVSREEVHFKNGRVLDRFGAPLVSTDGTYRGWAWYFRDVTDLKKTETALRRQEQNQRAIARAAIAISSSLDVPTTLYRVVGEAVTSLAEVCIVDLAGAAGRLDRVAWAARSEDLTKKLEEIELGADPDPDRPFGPPEVVSSGRSELYSPVDELVLSINARDPDHLRMLQQLGIKSALCVPLKTRGGRTVGCLTAISTSKLFDQTDLAVFESYGGLAGLAINNAQLYRDRVQVARTLQDSFLPPDSPRIPGLDVAARYHPAGDGDDVGGDFYDVFTTGKQSWAIVLGDVVGKGTDAAAITALARYTVRTAAMTPGKPSEILGVLNEAIYRQLDGEKYCTAVYAAVEVQGRAARATISLGGHPGPFLVKSDGKVLRLDCDGTLLGLFEQPNLTDLEVMLRPGDALVFYTDGVIEARGPTVAFGEGMLRSILTWEKDSDATTIAERIVKTVLEFQSGNASDDIAVLVLKVPKN